jgi:hypothetical protein
MAKPNGEQPLEFVFYPEPEHEWITLGNGERRIRCCIRQHLIVKQNARWVHVEHDPYGSVPPPDEKRRTFILSRRDLETFGAAYRRDKFPDHDTYYATERDAIASHGRDPKPEIDLNAEIEALSARWERVLNFWGHRFGLARSCFAELGIKSGASVEEIKAAFRKLSLERHPDVGGDQNSFVELRQAYEEALRLAKSSG